MNITSEKVSELELCIKINIEENDYSEAVGKQLKDYQKQATIRGFRKGNAPMGLIQRMYKPAAVSEAVQNTLNSSLFKYIDDEKLHILGTPLSNDEKTGTVDFEHDKNFTFYFDIALSPEFEIEWDKIDVKYNQIKTTAKDVDAEVNNACSRYGKFDTPESVSAGDIIYGKIVELDKAGNKKEGGVETFTSLNLLNLKDPESNLPIFEGKKADDKIVFNLSKTFPTADVERALRVDNAAAKKFKSDVEFTLSGISRIIPHELDADLFQKVFPDQKIKDAEAFRKAMHKEIDRSNNEQSDYLFVNQVRKSLIDNFTAPLPEDFLKRWFVSRNEDTTMEKLEAEWTEKYVPSLRWELIEGKLEEIKPINPTNNQIVDHIKEILRRNDQKIEGETAEQAEQRLEQAARSIAADRQNISQITDRIYASNLADLFKEKVQPEIEKVSAKEFAERAKQ
ncbi:MAG: trigger factor [Bacteroidales bacterium]|nr:trigger factor [Bacteroidales bacterium]